MCVRVLWDVLVSGYWLGDSGRTARGYVLFNLLVLRFFVLIWFGWSGLLGMVLCVSSHTVEPHSRRSRGYLSGASFSRQSLFAAGTGAWY